MASVNSVSSNDSQQTLLTSLKKLAHCDVMDSITHCCYPQKLKKELSNTAYQDLTKALEAFLPELLDIKDPLQFLDKLADALPEGAVTESDQESIQKILEESKENFEEAKSYFEMHHHPMAPHVRAHLSNIFDAIITVIDSIIKSFGIADFFKPAESDLHSDIRAQKLFMLISLFSMLAGILTPLIGARDMACVIGGSLLTMTALSLIWPKIRPKPSRLPMHAANLSKAVKNTNYVAGVNKGRLDQIARILGSNSHVLLKGPSRVGKTMTARALAQAIESGELPELKGMKVFHLNTTTLANNQSSFLGGGNDSVPKLANAMSPHQDSCILVLDEFHGACMGEHQYAEELKPDLDQGGDLRHVIAITTHDEYVKHIKDNKALANRFQIVEIDATDEQQTLDILQQLSAEDPQQPIVARGALQHIYQVSGGSEQVQPYAARRILEACMTRVRNSTVLAKEETRQNNQDELERTGRLLQTVKEEETQKLRTRIEELKAENARLVQEIADEKIRLEKLFKATKLLHRLRKQKYALIAKIQKLADKALIHGKHQLMHYALLQMMDPILETYLDRESEALGVDVMINERLVKKVKDEKDTREQAAAKPPQATQALFSQEVVLTLTGTGDPKNQLESTA